MSKDLDLTKLQVLKFAQSETQAQGREPIERFARLMLEQASALEGQDQSPKAEHAQENPLTDQTWVAWRLQGFFDPLDPHVSTTVDARAGFELEAHTAIKMTCQRCLGVCVQPLDVIAPFVLCAMSKLLWPWMTSRRMSFWSSPVHLTCLN